MQTALALSWKLLERGGSKALRLVVQIILARILTPDEFGSLAVLLVFISLGDILVLGGFGSALLQVKDADELDYSTAFWLSMGFAAAVCVLLALISPAVASFYSDPTLTAPLIALSLQFFPLSFNSIQVAKTTRALKMRPVFIGVMVSEVLASVVAILLACVGFGLWSLVLQQIISAFAVCVITSFMVRWHPLLRFSTERARLLFSFGWRVMATELVNTISMSLYTMVIGKQCSTEQLGYYSQGQRYPLAISEVLTGALSPVLLASFSQSCHSSQDRLRAVSKTTLRITVLVLAPMVLFCVFYAEPIVVLVLTEKWIPAVPIFQVFCIVSFAKSVALVSRQGMLAVGRPDLPVKIAVQKLVISLALLGIVVAEGLSLICVAMAWLVAGVLETAVSMGYCKKAYDFSLVAQAKALFPGIATAFLAGGAAWAVLARGASEMGSAVVFVGVSLAFALVFVRPYLRSTRNGLA